MRILNVDDNENNLYMIETLFNTKGNSVISAHNGAEALDILEDESPDLIISDILMPEVDGWQFCYEVRTNEKWKRIPFIFYTATYTSKKDEEFALSLGASRFIIKPEEPEIFLNAINNIAEESRHAVFNAPKLEYNDELKFIKTHNERLVNKLSKKVDQLEKANKDLQNAVEEKNREISERIYAEISLKRSEKLYRSLFDNMLNGFAYCNMLFDDEKPVDFRFITVNKAFEKHTGLENAEGRKISELIPGINETDPKFIEKFSRAAILGQSEVFDIYLEALKKWFSISVYGTALEHFVVIFDDITERKHSDEALRKSEERLRNAAEAASFGTYSYDFKTGKLYNSPEHLALYGLPADATIELDEDLTAKALHPEDKAAFTKAMKESGNSNGGKSGILDIEFRILCADGRMRWLKTKGRTVFDTNNLPIRTDGIVQDITEKKKAEEKIIKFNRIYAFLSEINKTIVRIDDQQELFDAACRIAVDTGGFRFCWIGVADAEHDRVVPAARYGFSDGFLETIRISLSADKLEGCGPTGTAIREKKFNICNDIMNDKKILPWREECLKRGYHSSASFPLTRGGNIYGIIIFYSSQADFFDEKEIRLLEELSSDISYCIDMLNREKRKQQVEKERDRFFNYSIDMMCIIGFDGHFKQLNPAWEKTLGWTIEELAAKPFIEIVHPEDRGSIDETGKKLMKNQRIINNDLNRIMCSDGTYKWLSWNMVIIPEEENIFAVARDITGIIENEKERKNLEAQLVQAQKLESLGTMAGGVAHDFNNILNIIMGYASVLKSAEKTDDREDYLNNLNVILDASRRGADLVKQLLTFARKSASVFQSVKVNNVIVETTKLLNETFPKNVEIKTEIQRDLPSIVADSTQIHQILLNLCVNARDAMDKGGTLAISAKRVGRDTIHLSGITAETENYIEICVSDTGTGMNEETKRKIFEPFFTTKEKGKGTGLGLALVYGIVKNHGGRIDLESEPGKGATFRIYLPVQEHNIEIDEKYSINEEEITQGEGTILLIEDEQISCELLKTILVLKGYKVITAHDGLQGITAYQDHKDEITAVISDLGLPKIGGDEVFRQINKINPGAKIMLISGYVDPEIKAGLHEQGVRYILQKPYMPEMILQTLKKVIESK